MNHQKEAADSNHTISSCSSPSTGAPREDTKWWRAAPRGPVALFCPLRSVKARECADRGEWVEKERDGDWGKKVWYWYDWGWKGLVSHGQDFQTFCWKFQRNNIFCSFFSDYKISEIISKIFLKIIENSNFSKKKKILTFQFFVCFQVSRFVFQTIFIWYG